MANTKKAIITPEIRSIKYLNNRALDAEKLRRDHSKLIAKTNANVRMLRDAAAKATNRIKRNYGIREAKLRNMFMKNQENIMKRISAIESADRTERTAVEMRTPFSEPNQNLINNRRSNQYAPGYAPFY